MRLAGARKPEAAFDFQMPEEDAFAVLVKLMQDYRMRDMFKPTMAELGLCMYQLENLVQVSIDWRGNSFQIAP